jgi:hypothetical protein
MGRKSGRAAIAYLLFLPIKMRIIDEPVDTAHPGKTRPNLRPYETQIERAKTGG